MNTLTEIACAHCTLPVPAGLLHAGDGPQFCCAGCQAVYSQIHACGLDDYYRYRDAGELLPQAASISDVDAEAFDSPAFKELYVRTESDQCSTELALEGVTCAACVWLVEQMPLRLPGLIDARMSLTDNTLRVRWNAEELKLSQIAAELMRFGYRPHPARQVKQGDLFRRELRSRLVDLGIAGALSGNTMLLAAALYAGWMQGIDRPFEQLLRWLSLGLGLAALIWPGREFFRGAMASVRLRVVNFDLPIALALATGGIAGTVNVVRGHGEIYFDSLSALIFLLLVGRLIQFCQQRRARGAVELLFSLTPSTCRVVETGQCRTLPIEALEAGQVVEVHAEELFPADGAVVGGASTVDTSLLTGESRPVAVAAGDTVCAGARNVESTLRVEIQQAGRQTRVGRLMQLVEQGLAEKPPIVRLTDRVTARFTAVVLAAAIVTFAVWLRHGIPSATETVVALLIVTCPCVLGLAVPLTFAMAIGRLARRGILVKSASALERLARGGRLVLDKTGTLTTGQMQLVAWEGEANWQGVVSAMERDSLHPVGRVLRKAYEHCEPPAQWRGPLAIQTRTGGGVVATLNDTQIIVGSPRMIADAGADWTDDLRLSQQAHEAAGRTVVGVAVAGRVRAIVALADAVRPEAAAAIQALRRRGYEPEICSGDVPCVVNTVASQLHVIPALARGGMLPEEKLDCIRQGGAVMVGDGVNDAAALAAADVGVAVSGGAEAALAAADVYIARPGLAGLVDLVDTARHTLRVVHRNVAIATSYNILAGTLAVAGYMHPLMAACLMPLSSATVLTLTMLAVRRGPRRHTV